MGLSSLVDLLVALHLVVLLMAFDHPVVDHVMALIVVGLEEVLQIVVGLLTVVEHFLLSCVAYSDQEHSP